MRKKTDRRALFSGIVIFILLPMLLGVLMYARTLVVVHRYVERQVTAQAEILKQLASRRLVTYMEELERVAGYFRDGGIEESRMSAATDRLLQNPIQLFHGILRLDGTPVCGKALRASEYPAILNTFRGKNTVRYRKGEGLLFAVPIYNGNNIKYAFYEFFDAEEMFTSFSDTFYGGQCRLMLADSAQQIIMPIANEISESDPWFHNPEVEEAFDFLSEQMNSNLTATVFCRSEGQGLLIFVSQMEQQNLYLVGIVPYKTAAGSIGNLTGMLIVVFALLMMLMVFGTIRIVSADARARESDELRQAKHIAEEASKSKSRFLASMSHELRTPINTIMGMDEMLLRESSDPTTREHAMDIKSAAQILLGLINDVLDFSKIESGMLTIIPEEYDLAALIRDLALLSENRAKAKSLNFHMNVQSDLPIGLYGDTIRIRQVLANLLTNAVKYTPAGTVTLDIAGTRGEENHITLHIKVADTGTGIKPEDIPKLFIPYTRIEEARNRNVEGSGLGLPIIINLLRLMGSELKVQSTYGEGSTFSFDLKQKVVDEQPVGNIHTRLANMVRTYEYRVTCVAPKARILMVDDNAMNRKIFTSLLKQTQIPITAVSSGKKCLEIVKQQHFDLIFMDHLMPEMDGVETLQHLREMDDNLCKGTPVIALTANAFSNAREKYLSLGFDGFLAKPIETEKLESLLCEMLPKGYLETIPVEAGDALPLSLPETPTEDLPDIEGVNWNYALLYVKDSDLLLDTLQDFYRSIDREAKEIAALFEGIGTEEGLKAYRTRVHSMKSAAAAVGILSVSEVARLLENAAYEGDLPKIMTATPLLLDELQKTKQRLHPFMGDSEEKQELADPSLLLAMLDMLHFALAEQDIHAADNTMKQIKSYVYEPSVQEVVDRLDGLVAQLDFDTAAAAVQELLARLMNKATD